MLLGGIAVALLIVAAAAIAVVFRIRSNQSEVITDFTAILQQGESEAVNHARGYVDDWAPWADQASPSATRVDTDAGFVYMVTFEQNRARDTQGSSDFNPRFIVIVDPLTGETGFAVAP